MAVSFRDEPRYNGVSFRDEPWPDGERSTVCYMSVSISPFVAFELLSLFHSGDKKRHYIRFGPLS